MHKYWKEGDMECAVPVEVERTLTVIEAIVRQNELILQGLFFIPSVDRSISPLPGTECNSSTAGR